MLRLPVLSGPRVGCWVVAVNRLTCWTNDGEVYELRKFLVGGCEVEGYVPTWYAMGGVPREAVRRAVAHTLLVS